MINTRLSIFTTLKKALDDLFKRARINPEGFRDILLAVIMNDLKQWSEYIPSGDSEKLNDLLTEYIISHKNFKIERFIEDEGRYRYRNVNTEQDNTDWNRIWDNKYAKYIDEVSKDGDVIVLPDCVQILTYNKCCNGNNIM